MPGSPQPWSPAAIARTRRVARGRDVCCAAASWAPRFSSIGVAMLASAARAAAADACDAGVIESTTCRRTWLAIVMGSPAAPYGGPALLRDEDEQKERSAEDSRHGACRQVCGCDHRARERVA